MHSAWAVAGGNLPALADLYARDGLEHLTLGAEETLVAAHLPPDPRPSNSAKAPARGTIDLRCQALPSRSQPKMDKS